MSLYKAFATSSSRETEGTPIYFPANDDGTKPTFYLAHAASTNPAFVAAIERLQKKLKMVIDLDMLSAKDADPAMREVFLDCLLKGWENVRAPGKVGGEGVPGEETELEYSRDNAEKLFDDLPSLYFTLMAECRKLSNFRLMELGAITEKH